MTAKAPSSPILQLIRRVIDDPRTLAASDAELLRALVAGTDDGAFSALVRRYGPMVLDVCRAVLGNEADTEDAFQATFLVLARKASSIRKTASLCSWLHGVAYRTALKAQAEFAKRRKHEARLPRTEACATEDLSWSEIQLVLHDELNRLGERHRAPLVLCYLEGKPQDEAAAQLGLPKATLKHRLERGRALLRARLVRRGLGPAGVLLAAAWPVANASARLSAELAASTVQAGVLAVAGAPGPVSVKVAGLADAMVRTMYLAKVRSVALLTTLIAVLGLGGGSLIWRSEAAQDRTALQERDQAPGLAGQASTKEADRDATVARNVVRFVDHLKRNPAQRLPGGETLGLFVLNLRGGPATLIASVVDQERAYCGSPSWSQDGRRILFDASPGKEFAKTRVQILELTEQGVGLASFGMGNCPTLSPDGKRIAYLVNPGAIAGARMGIHVMNADGSDRRYLGGGGIPKWSPDGRRLLTISFSTPCRLTLMDPDTGDERLLQLPGHQIHWQPSWADERTLAAVIRADKAMSIALLDVSDPDAVAVKETLWKRGDGATVEPMYPLVSPRSGQCIFVGREKKGQALYTVERSQAPVRLEPNQEDVRILGLALSPDGRYLLFCSERH